MLTSSLGSLVTVDKSLSATTIGVDHFDPLLGDQYGPDSNKYNSHLVDQSISTFSQGLISAPTLATIDLTIDRQVTQSSSFSNIEQKSAQTPRNTEEINIIIRDFKSRSLKGWDEITLIALIKSVRDELNSKQFKWSNVVKTLPEKTNSMCRSKFEHMAKVLKIPCPNLKLVVKSLSTISIDSMIRAVVEFLKASSSGSQSLISSSSAGSIEFQDATIDSGTTSTSPSKPSNSTERKKNKKRMNPQMEGSSSSSTGKKRKKDWNKTQEGILKEWGDQHPGNKQWKNCIKSHPELTGFSSANCTYKYTTLTEASKDIIKGDWTPQEDDKLRIAVKRHRTPNGTSWSGVATEFPHRNSTQCRKRWHDHLSKTIPALDGEAMMDISDMAIDPATRAQLVRPPLHQSLPLQRKEVAMASTSSIPHPPEPLSSSASSSSSTHLAEIPS